MYMFSACTCSLEVEFVSASAAADISYLEMMKIVKPFLQVAPHTDKPQKSQRQCSSKRAKIMNMPHAYYCFQGIKGISDCVSEGRVS